MEASLQSKSKSKKSSKSMKHKKKRIEKHPLNGDEDSDDLSPNKELHSIGHYVNDRQEMIEQMFSTMSEEKLRAMLPPILKDETIATLQSNCLEALLGMSSKRIKSILAGEDLGSQSSETESDESHQSHSSDDAKEDEEITPVAAPKKSEGENLLEIVELQLRARAIRAALVHQCASPEPLRDEGESIKRSMPVDEPVQDKSCRDIDEFGKPGGKDSIDGVVIIVDSPEDSNLAEDAVDQAIKDNSCEDTATPIVVINNPLLAKSKKNIVMIGPKRKTKNIIMYSKQSKVSGTDNNGNGIGNEIGVSPVVAKEESKEATVPAMILIKNEETMEVEDTATTSNVQSGDEDKSEQADENSQSWMQRWLHIQETDTTNAAQKKTSKIITTVKQKLRDESKKIEESRKTNDPTPDVQPTLEVMGTVCEYQLLPQSSIPMTPAETTVEDTTAINDTDVAEDIRAAEDEVRPAVDLDKEPVVVETSAVEVMAATETSAIEATVSETSVVQESADDLMCSDELELHYEDIDDDILKQTTTNGDK